MNEDAAQKVISVLGPGPECPPLEDLLSALADEQGQSRNAEVSAHLSGCPSCKAELALFQSFESSEVRAEERVDVDAIVARLRKNSPVEKQSWWARISQVRVWAPASVAFAVLALALTIWIPRTPDRGPEVSGSGDTLRSHSITIISPMGDIPQVPNQFRWNPVGDAAQYKIALTEVDGTKLWDGSSGQTWVVLPASVRLKLTPLKTVNWRVRALNSTGSEVGDSGLKPFRLTTSAR